MRDGARARIALFVGASLAMIAVALLFALQRSDPTTPSPEDAKSADESAADAEVPTPSSEEREGALRRAARLQASGEDLQSGESPPPALTVERAALEKAALRFLGAFFRYEVGALTPELKRKLSSSSTPEFAAELLAAPPRAVAGGQLPPLARVQGLEIFFTGSDGFSAQVNGSARRRGPPEPFSFTFERRGAVWLAAGIGQ